MRFSLVSIRNYLKLRAVKAKSSESTATNLQIYGSKVFCVVFMVSESVRIAADVGEAVTMVVALSAYIPQWITLFRNKSSENISSSTWMIWSFSATLSFFYAVVQYLINPATIVLLVSTAGGFLFNAITFAAVVYYRKHPTQNQHQENLAVEIEVIADGVSHTAQVLEEVANTNSAEVFEYSAKVSPESPACLSTLTNR